jgi:excisionase family DNA binding protein
MDLKSKKREQIFTKKKILLTVPQAARRMTISEKSTWRMVYAQKLEVVRIGRSVRVTEDSVDGVIDMGTTPPHSPTDNNYYLIDDDDG